MRQAVHDVRFLKQSSTLVGKHTKIPARTIRRYVIISKSPARALDSPYFVKTAEESLRRIQRAVIPEKQHVIPEAQSSEASEACKVQEEHQVPSNAPVIAAPKNASTSEPTNCIQTPYDSHLDDCMNRVLADFVQDWGQDYSGDNDLRNLPVPPYNSCGAPWTASGEFDMFIPEIT
jgi:hypothetical protein